jgi:predicted transcriptional regulator
MTSNSPAETSGLSKHQLDLIEQFESLYNTIDRVLRNELRSPSKATFRDVVEEYCANHRGWPDVQLMRTTGNVRNAMVHTKTEPYRYLVLPTSEMIQQLAAACHRLIKPARVIPVFHREVKTVSPDDSLAHVLKLVRERNFSQFPVIGAHGFRGLLTENGITRWIAEHVGTSMSLVDFQDVTVAQALADEEKRKNHRFVARNALADDVVALFAANRLLEAVFITDSGKTTEKLLGIATRWDIPELYQEKP